MSFTVTMGKTPNFTTWFIWLILAKHIFTYAWDNKRFLLLWYTDKLSESESQSANSGSEENGNISSHENVIRHSAKHNENVIRQSAKHNENGSVIEDTHSFNGSSHDLLHKVSKSSHKIKKGSSSSKKLRHK